MQPISERELQATLIAAGELVGRQVFHLEDARKVVRSRNHNWYALVDDSQAAGYPDLTIARQGQVLWAELKGSHGRLDHRLDHRQVNWLDHLPPHHACVWKPENLDQPLEIINAGNTDAASARAPCGSPNGKDTETAVPAAAALAWVAPTPGTGSTPWPIASKSG